MSFFSFKNIKKFYSNNKFTINFADCFNNIFHFYFFVYYKCKISYNKRIW